MKGDLYGQGKQVKIDEQVPPCQKHRCSSPAYWRHVAGKRSITADTDLRLCKLFGLSDGWWLRLQASYDTVIAK